MERMKLGNNGLETQDEPLCRSTLAVEFKSTSRVFKLRFDHIVITEVLREDII